MKISPELFTCFVGLGYTVAALLCLLFMLRYRNKWDNKTLFEDLYDDQQGDLIQLSKNALTNVLMVASWLWPLCVTLFILGEIKYWVLRLFRGKYEESEQENEE